MSVMFLGEKHIAYILNTAVCFGALPGDAEALKQLGLDLMEVNRRAHVQRYPDGDCELLTALTQSFQLRRSSDDLTIVQALKAIECFNYQCSDIPAWSQTSEYHTLQRIKRLLIGALPGYAQARWVIE